jgi:hypothetical protein
MGIKVGLWLGAALTLFACGEQPERAQPAPARAQRLAAVQGQRSAAHAFQSRGDAAFARNAALDFGIRVMRDRAELSQGHDQLVLRWTGIGRRGAMREPDVATALDIDGQRVSRAHGTDRAWFVNGRLGLEHGFEIGERPHGSGGLILSVQLEGLEAMRGRYTALHAEDAVGRTLPSRMVFDGERVELRIDDAGARYPVTIDPLLWLDGGRIEPLSPGAFEHFGWAAAVSDDTLVIGAVQDVGGSPGPGSGYVFVESGNTWTQQAELQADDGDFFDHLGYAVAIDGDTLVAGAWSHVHSTNRTGAAYVFVRNGAAWTQQAELLPSVDENNHYFGESVAIEGDTILVGARGVTTKTVYVFTRSGNVWSEVATLAPTLPATEAYPFSVALSGDTAVVGDPGDDELGHNSGAAYVFTGSGASWTQEAKLTSPQALPGVPGFVLGAGMGRSVSIDGDTIVLGAPTARAGVRTGAAGVFTRSAGVWTQERWLVGSDSADDDNFGYCVAVDGDLLAVGAPGNDELAFDGGAAYVFTRSGGMWPEQTKLLAPDATDDDEYGISLGLSGNTVVAGSWQDDDEVGAGRVFRYASTGQPCTADGECPTGFCVDGVCCNEACGGDSTDDCLACAEALSGLPDGVCGLALDGVPCLQDGFFCNGEESCASGVCMSEGDPCAPATGDGDDDCSDVCDESAKACSAPEPENAPCDDGLFCTAADHCERGVCTGTDPCVEAADGDADCTESCDEATASCTAPDEEGASCADGGICGAGVCLAPLAAPCDQGDACASGICTDGICCTQASCGAYRCGPAGDCLTGCTNTSECQPEHQCSAAGTCELIADFEVGDDGCGCRTAGRRGDFPSWLWLAGLALVRRRRSA